MGPAASLAGMPAELVLRIADFLCPNLDAHIDEDTTASAASTGQADLSRLSQTCIRFRNLVQPVVFKTVSDTGLHGPFTISMYLHAVKSRPDLATSLVAAVIRYAGPLALALAQYATNLQFLRVERLGSTMPIESFGPYLSNPKSLQVDDSGTHETRDILAFGNHLPNLKALTLGYVGNMKNPDEDISETYVNNFYDSINPLPNIRKFGIGQVERCHTLHLVKVLTLLPGLEDVEMKCETPREGEHDAFKERAVAIWQIIASRKETLKRLDWTTRMGMTEGTKIQWSATDIKLTRDSLADFEKLEYLRIAGHMLSMLDYNWTKTHGKPRPEFLENLLPKGLRRLELPLPRISIGTMVRLASAAQKGKLPALKMVVVGRGPETKRPVGLPRYVHRIWYGGTNEYFNWVWFTRPGGKVDLVGDFAKAGVKFHLELDVEEEYIKTMEGHPHN
ncbi:hypothetical protein OQA88_12470 [Cercophora sp. LCS_1]